MTTLSRIRVDWTGTPVIGPAMSTFYANGDLPTALGALHTFFEALKTNIPSGVTITVPNSGDDIDDATGALVGTWSSGSAQATACSNAGSYVQGVGCRFRWRTAGIVGGRRVNGSTFIVPMGKTTYGTDGTVLGTVVTTFQTAGDALVSSAGSILRIWSRPIVGRAGSSSVITAAVMPDAVSWLRTRRT